MTTFLNMKVSELPSTHKLCYLGDCNFTRASVAYDYKGDEVAINQPRFTHRVPDTTVTNLLTGNQSDGGDTNNPELLTLNQRTGTDYNNLTLNQQTGTDTLGDITGFLTVIPGDDTSLESSSTESHSGNKSLKVTTAGIQANEGIKLSTVTVTNSSAYVCSCWIKSDAVGREIRLTATGGLTGQNFTITGEWQYLEITGTTTSTSFYPHVKNPNDDGEMTFYVDDFNLYGPTGFLPISDKTNTIESSTEQAHSGNRSLKCVTGGDATYEGMATSNTTITAGTTYIGGVWVYAPLGASMQLRIACVTENFYQTFTGTGDWQWVETSFATTSSTSAGIWVRTYGTAQAITFFVDDLRLAKNDTTNYTAYSSATISVTGETSSQGYRSIKCQTPGTVTSEGFWTGFTSVDGTTYTVSAKIKAPEGSQLYIYNISTFKELFVGTGDWEDINLTLTASGTWQRIYFFTSTVAQAITFYVDECMVETGSEAHNWAYGGSSYSTYKMEQGCLVEEAHANLLTANQSTGTDTNGDTTGFANTVYGTTTFSSSPDKFIQGTKSLKVSCSGAAVGEGVMLVSANTTENTTHTASAWILMPEGTPFRFSIYEGTSYANIGNAYYTGTGEWQFITISGTVPTGKTKVYCGILTSEFLTGDFYVDMLQITATAYPLSWTLGGITQALETLTTPSNVLNIDAEGYSNLLGANVSSGTDTSSDTTGFSSGYGATLSSSTEQYHQGSRSLKVETPGSVELEGTYISALNTAVGEDYTFSGWFYVPTGATLRVQMYQSGTSVVQNINGTGDWQYIDLTKTSTTTSMAIYIQTITSAQAITFYIDELQVSATNEAKPWILGGTYSGLTTYTIEGEVFANIPMFKYVTGRYSTMFYAHTAENRNLHTLYKEVGAVQFRYKLTNESGTSDYNIITNSLISDQWNRFNARLDVDSSKLTVANSSNTRTNPPIGSFYPTMIYLGCGPAVGSVWRESNTIIRNFVISTIKRTDEDVTARAESDLPVVDEHCTMIYPLTKDLSAYRVVER